MFNCFTLCLKTTGKVPSLIIATLAKNLSIIPMYNYPELGEESQQILKIDFCVFSLTRQPLQIEITHITLQHNKVSAEMTRCLP